MVVLSELSTHLLYICFQLLLESHLPKIAARPSVGSSRLLDRMARVPFEVYIFHDERNSKQEPTRKRGRLTM